MMIDQKYEGITALRKLSAPTIVNRARDIVLHAVLLAVWMIPGMMLSFKSLQEPWTMFRFARTGLSLPEGHILTFTTSAAAYRAEHIGGEVLQAALLQATAWPLSWLAVLPLGSLVLPLLYYLMARELCASRWAAAAISVYAAWYYPSLFSQYGTQTYVWAHALLFAFLVVFRHWLTHVRPLLSLLIMLLFTATFLHYHTVPLWIVVALALAVLVFNMRTVVSVTDRRSASWALPIFAIVLYFSFDTVVYGNGLVRLRAGGDDSLIRSFFAKVLSPLFGASSHNLAPYQVAPTNPRLATYTTLAVLLLLTVPMGLWCLSKLRQVLLYRGFSSTLEEADELLVWLVVMMAVTHAILYSSYGALSIRVIPLVFPLMLPVIVRRCRNSKSLEIGLASSLAAAAVIGFASFASFLQPDVIAAEVGMADKLLKPNARIMSDANVYGSLLLNATKDNKLLDYVWLDENKYAAVVGHTPRNSDDADYFAVDLLGKPLTAASWAFFEPWTEHLSGIRNNKNLDNIYQSDNLMVLQPAGQELPDHYRASVAAGGAGRSLVGDAVRLWLALIALFVLPAAVFGFLLFDRAVFKEGTTSAYIATGIGLSMVSLTFLGYLVNFTPLGLRWLVPLAIVVPLSILVSYVATFRPRWTVNREWVRKALLTVMPLLVWSVVATGVAHRRDELRSDFAEFFLTNVSSDSTALNVNMVNRGQRSTEVEVVVETDRDAVVHHSFHTLPPNSTWSEPIIIADNTTLSNWLLVRITRDSFKEYELWWSKS